MKPDEKIDDYMVPVTPGIPMWSFPDNFDGHEIPACASWRLMQLAYQDGKDND